MSESCCCYQECDWEPGKDYCHILPLWRTAPHRYKCDECGDAIKKGSRYEFIWGRWDDHWFIHRTCGICMKIREDFFCGPRVLGSMREDFFYCMEFDYVTGEEEEARS